MKNRRKKYTLIALSIISSIGILYFAIGFIFYHFALNANATQSRTIGEKMYEPSAYIDATREQAEREKDRDFLNTMKPSVKSITSYDDLSLQAYVYEQPTPTNDWVLAVHGYTGSARQMTRWNRQLYELGYNVFAPDLRGHGQSEGNYYGMGWLDQQDLQDWLHLLINEYPEANITLYGVSMGASAVLNLAASDLPKQVDTVIADSGFTSVAEIFETQLNDTLHLPSFPIMNAANSVSKLRINLDFYQASTVALVPNIKIPIFYIHGGLDDFVPVSNVHALAKATSSPHHVWVVENANHGEAVKVQPDEYRKRLHEFIQNERD